MPENEGLDPASIRARLKGTRGREYWQSLDELAGSPEFEAMLRSEHPRYAGQWLDPVNRRSFLRLMGASLALAGVSGCYQQPAEKIVPYVRAPEELLPGKPLFFATSVPAADGESIGVLVESHEGRPTKIEGNPDHPSSLGATDALTQAAILALYDPDRSQTISRGGQIDTWERFIEALLSALAKQGPTKGAGLRVLSPTVGSPTLARQVGLLLEKFPNARWHQWEPAGRDNVRGGARLAFGDFVDTVYRFDQAQTVVSLDADFLASGAGTVRYTRDFISRRRPAEDGMPANRLYAIESTPSLTGAKADHLLPVRASAVDGVARELARRLGVPLSGPAAALGDTQTRWMNAVVKELSDPAHRGKSLVVAGNWQPPSVHALAHAMNEALGNVGNTLYYTKTSEPMPVFQLESIRELCQDMTSGKVEALVVMGGNPAYDAPSDLEFGKAIRRVRNTFRVGLHEDETSALCQWHAPAAHSLESWSDGRSFEGTIGILQPLVAPLYGGHSFHEIVAAMMGQPGRPGHDIVRETWKAQYPASDFEVWWQTALHDGLVKGSASPAAAPALKIKGLPALGVEGLPASPALPAGELELVFRPDPTIWDGRHSNNGWLQELPKPLTKLTWDNVALMSKQLAERLHVANEDMVDLVVGDRRVSAPVWILPGHPGDSVTVHLGYGRTRAGRAGTGAGFDAYGLRTSGAPWVTGGLKVLPAQTTYKLACTQTHHSMEGRDLVRVLEPGVVEPPHEAEQISMYPEYKYDHYKWAMSIDVNSCVGCNACVVACQSENNIPIVGKTEVMRGREMHWNRVDRYYRGDAAEPETYHQPVPCMHCENAPCELVCPVGATSHSEDGLNDMAYNRCVGTKYCSNNCPYKVRRFNFFQYADYETESLKMLRNPDVSVRELGVMEKCTYCVQRINTGRIAAEKESRKVRDGEIVTACQQACPAQAIVFGDLNDPTSQVSKLKADGRNYSLLEELNTRPRTTYLAAIRNPSEELGKKGKL